MRAHLQSDNTDFGIIFIFFIGTGKVMQEIKFHPYELMNAGQHCSSAIVLNNVASLVLMVMGPNK